MGLVEPVMVGMTEEGVWFDGSTMGAAVQSAEKQHAKRTKAENKGLAMSVKIV